MCAGVIVLKYTRSATDRIERVVDSVCSYRRGVVICGSVQ